MEAFQYQFLSIRGIQAGKEFYSSMCPLKLIPKIFLYDEEELEPELRAQRTLNRSRIPEIARYIVENPKEYIFSAITASIDGDVIFEPLDEHGTNRNVGKLIIPMSARFLINDGQHRRAAIEEALKQWPQLGDENISVVFFLDNGLKKSQQMFADLNKHAVRPTKSLGILYDHRDPLSELSRNLIGSVSFFKGFTETEKTTISNRSIKLFTLSSVYQATKALLDKTKKLEITTPEEEALAKDFWEHVGKYIPDWQLAVSREVSAAELRKTFIHAHGLALVALGRMGHDLISAHPRAWKTKLMALKKVDWTRSNLKIWDGRATVGGRVSKARDNIILTTNLLKTKLDLPLNDDEKKVESVFKRNRKLLRQ
jgi:DNA sulfur modification protein DndB